MSQVQEASATTGDPAVVEAAIAGDERAFGELVARYERRLHVHCYRMTGSVDEADDAVQETYLRAWRSRGTFRLEGRWSFQAWLYRIATNVCLNSLARSPRRVLPSDLGPPAPAGSSVAPAVERPWLQPYPDHLLAGLGADDAGPEQEAVTRETVELAFLAAIQHLSPRERAAFLSRDVLGWSTTDVASALEASVAATNSALQRARAKLRAELPRRRSDWGRGAGAPTTAEREVLQRYMRAHESADAAVVAALLHEEARGMMPPSTTWYLGRDAIGAAVAMGFDPWSPSYAGDIRCLPTGANGQPAAACYARRPGDSVFSPLSLDVLSVEEGLVVEVVGFGAGCFPAFCLPPAL